MNRTVSRALSNTTAVLSAGVLLLAGLGCPPPKTEGPVTKVVPLEKLRPENLTATAEDKSIHLTWTERRTSPISGYLVYLDTIPLLETDGTMRPDAAPYNPVPFPGDLNPEDDLQELELSGLQNGLLFHVVVRTMFPDRSLSGPSNEVTALCGPRMQARIGIRYKTESDGVSLVRGIVVRADDPDNDLFFSAKDGEDYLGSPHRISDGGRQVQFAQLKRAHYMSGVRLPSPAALNWQDREPIGNGDWLLVRTPESCYGLIHVDSLTGAGDQRSVWLTAAYCPLPNRLLFWHNNEVSQIELGDNP